MNFAKTISLLFLLICSVAAQPTEGGSKYGERPENSVFDPRGILSVEETKEISEPLLKIRENERIDIFVVIVPEIGDAPPMHVAEGYAEKWKKEQINAVILHVPGAEESPWIFPGKLMSSALKPEVKKKSIEDAEARARAESTDFAKVKAASTEAADIMRFWTGIAHIRSEEAITRRLNAKLAFERRERLLKLALMLGAAALIPLIVGAVFFFVRLRGSGSKTFPSIRVVRRLGAPFTGGNHAAIDS